MSDRLQTVALSNLSRPDGSAVYSFGNTVIQCNIYGPGEVNQSKEKVDKTTVEVVFKKRIKPVNRGKFSCIDFSYLIILIHFRFSRC